MKYLFSFLLLFLSIVGFAQDKNATITIKALGSTNDEVLITSSTMFWEEDTLAKARLTNEGKTVVSIKLLRSSFVNIKIGNKIKTGYLSPGDQLKITSDLNDDKSIYKFTGRGSEANNYLAQSNLVFERYFRLNGKQINEFETEIFASRLDSMEKAFADFHRDYTSRVNLPKSVSYLLEITTRIAPLHFKLNYVAAHYNTMDEREKMPELLKKTYSEVPLNDELVTSNYSDYSRVLYYYLSDIWLPFVAGKTLEERKQILPQLPKLAAQAIKKEQYSPAIEELLLAKNVYEAFSQGLTPVTLSVFNSFKSSFPNSAHLSALEKKYYKRLALAQGSKAPDFMGVTPDGKKLSLSDLKGKIIYADVWATWCGPCREELPKAKEIQRKFADNKKVEFLYISVDRNNNDWTKFLKADPDFKGTHINISDDEQISHLYKSYQMVGVPTYLLIDREGKIVSSVAPRPSSGKVENEIQALLK